MMITTSAPRLSRPLLVIAYNCPPLTMRDNGNLSCMVRATTTGYCQSWGRENRRLSLGIGGLIGWTDDDGQTFQGNVFEPAGDGVVHKEVQSHQALCAHQGDGHLAEVDKSPFSSVSPRNMPPWEAARDDLPTAGISGALSPAPPAKQTRQ